MSIDISQFYQVFFEEAAEHLAVMESLLLSLDIENPNSESLHAIFRAAHSIKGGAGTFGFNDLTEATHVMESLLDRLRNQELTLTSAMVDAFLASGDVLRAQLGAHQNLNPAVDPEVVRLLCDKLQSFSDVSVNSIILNEIPNKKHSSSNDSSHSELSSKLETNAQKYSIDFFDVPHGVSWPGLECEVGRLGKLQHDHVGEHHTFFLETQSPIEDIHECLTFVLQTSQYAINAILSSPDNSSYGFFDDELSNDFNKSNEDSSDYDPIEGVEHVLIAYAQNNASKQMANNAQQTIPQFDEMEMALIESAVEMATYQSEIVEAGYGFFVPLETLHAAAPSADSNITSKDQISKDQPPKEELGYGFFTDLPEVAAEVKSDIPTEKISAPINHLPHIEEKKAIPITSRGGHSQVIGRREGDKVEEEAKAGRRSSDKVTTQTPDNTSIRVSVEKVDQMLNLVGELVITQAMLMQGVSQVDPTAFEILSNCLAQLERNTRDLQESVMSIRMMPISFVFSRFPRVVRDVASRLGKQVELKLEGEGTELDRGLIEKIADPLTHLVRNSLDHGIELPEVRRSRGKPEKGTLTLTASHQGGHIVIEVRDDGGGLNRDKILAKALERGMAISKDITDQEIWALIFEAGFSTADQVTDVSGRGVGMDVVKRNIIALGGSIEINTALGVGTSITIRLPLTLAILDGMSVDVGGETFIIPLASVIESLRPEASSIHTVSGNCSVLKVRDEYIPVLDLHEVFTIPKPEGFNQLRDGIVVVMEANSKKAAVWVDNLLGQPQVVIKSLESNYKKVKGFSGATIMGDGRVALIIDVITIVNQVNDNKLNAGGHK